MFGVLHNMRVSGQPLDFWGVSQTTATGAAAGLSPAAAGGASGLALSPAGAAGVEAPMMRCGCAEAASKSRCNAPRMREVLTRAGEIDMCGFVCRGALLEVTHVRPFERAWRKEGQACLPSVPSHVPQLEDQ